jgi:hypothetical protein
MTGPAPEALLLVLTPEGNFFGWIPASVSAHSPKMCGVECSSGSQQRNTEGRNQPRNFSCPTNQDIVYIYSVDLLQRTLSMSQWFLNILPKQTGAAQ